MRAPEDESFANQIKSAILMGPPGSVGKSSRPLCEPKGKKWKQRCYVRSFFFLRSWYDVAAAPLPQLGMHEDMHNHVPFITFMQEMESHL
jgi:hypothetical protein